MNRVRTTLRAGTLAAALLLCASCLGADARPGGILEVGQTKHRVCAPAHPEGLDSDVFGFDIIKNGGDTALTIRDVTLLDSVDLRLAEAWLVTIGPRESLVGGRYMDDLEETFRLPAAWDDRVDAVGARLEPGQSVNLVVVVGLESDELGRAEATRVEYEVRGRRWYQDTPMGIVVSPTSCDGIWERLDAEY